MTDRATQPGASDSNPQTQAPRRQATAQYLGVLLFSLSLGITLVAYPLFVVDLGRSEALAGALIGFSGAVQVLTRWRLGDVMRLVSNSDVIRAAGVFWALGVGLLVVSSSLLALSISAVLQGVARAFFWTGNQVQIVRSPGSTPKGIATLNMVATVAMLVGPVVGGLIAQNSYSAAFGAAAVVALVGVVPTLALKRHPPFDKVGGHRYLKLLQHRGVRVGVWASIAIGAWRGLLGSFVPIGLDAGGASEFLIGVILAIANGVSALGGYLAVKIEGPQVARSVSRWGLVTLVATTYVCFDVHLVAISVGLVVAGLSVGVLQVLAITAVSDAVRPELQGDAVTMAGVARGLTLSGAPLGVSTALLATSLGPAVLVVTVLLVAPSVLFSRSRGRDTSGF